MLQKSLFVIPTNLLKNISGGENNSKSEKGPQPSPPPPSPKVTLEGGGGTYGAGGKVTATQK